MDTRTLPLPLWTDMLESGEPFALSRWGDGEWAALLGATGENCDGHQYLPGMGEALGRILIRNRPYYKGYLAISRLAGEANIVHWLDQHAPAIEWVNGDTLLDASIAGEFAPFLRALGRRRMVYVGPAHLKRLGAVAGLNMQNFLTVPDTNAFAWRNQAFDLLYPMIRQLKPGDVVGFSAGFLSKALIDDLFPFCGHRISLIDFGSLFDGYVGVVSRSHNRKTAWPTALQANLSGARHEK